MANISYEKAEELMKNDNFSRLEKLSLKKHIILPPKYLGRVKEGITEQLNSEMRLVSDTYGGALISYNNIKLHQHTGQIMDEMPYIHFDIEADFIVFRPVIGCTLRAKVNKISEHHIGCLVHEYFNASIHKPRHAVNGWRGSEMKIGDEFQFEVSRIYTHNKVLSMRGHLPDTGNNIKKRKQSYISTDSHLSDVSISKHKKFDDNDESVDSSLMHSESIIENSTATENDSMMWDADTSNTKRKKKKKKHKHDDSEYNVKSDSKVSDGETSAENRKRKKKHKHDHDESEYTVQSDSKVSDMETSVENKKKKKKHKKEKCDDTLEISSILSENESFAKVKKSKKDNNKDVETELSNVNCFVVNSEPDSMLGTPKKKKKHKRSKISNEEENMTMKMTNGNGSVNTEADGTIESPKRKEKRKHKNDDAQIEVTYTNGSLKMEPGESLQSPKQKKHKKAK